MCDRGANRRISSIPLDNNVTTIPNPANLNNLLPTSLVCQLNNRRVVGKRIKANWADDFVKNPAPTVMPRINAISNRKKSAIKMVKKSAQTIRAVVKES